MRQVLPVWCIATQFVAFPLWAQTAMTIDEYQLLCGSDKEQTAECMLYTRGLVDGAFERVTQDMSRCCCKPGPRADELLEEIEAEQATDGSSFFLIQHPFEAFGACTPPDDRIISLEPGRIALSILGEYRDSNVSPQTPASKLLVWALTTEAERSCTK